MVQTEVISPLTDDANFSTKYFAVGKVYTDKDGITWLYHGCPHVQEINHSLKLVDYLLIQVNKPWYKCYLSHSALTIIQAAVGKQFVPYSFALLKVENNGFCML